MNALPQERIEAGNLVITGGPRGTARVEGGELRLTAFEFSVLYVLASRPDQYVSIDTLLAALYGTPDKAPLSGSLAVIVGRLRQKLRDAEATVAVMTVRGRGYRLDVLAKGG